MLNKDRLKNMNDDELSEELSLIAGWDRSEYNKAKRDSAGIVGWMKRWLNTEVIKND